MLTGLKVRALSSSQSTYDAHTACSFTAMFFCHYMLYSDLERLTVSLDQWTALACKLYLDRNSRTEVAKLPISKQSAGVRSDQYYTPLEVHRSVVTPRETMRLLEENLVFLGDSDTDRGGHRVEFEQQKSTLPLWKLLRKLLLRAVSAPVAVTCVTSTNTCSAFGVRWRAAVPDATRQWFTSWLRGQLGGITDPDRLDAQAKPRLSDIETTLSATSAGSFDGSIPPLLSALFHIDFMDSHRNNDAFSGLPRESAGSGVWIEFDRLTGLVTYLQRRLDSDQPVYVDCISWEASADEARLCTDIEQLYTDPSFQTWWKNKLLGTPREQPTRLQALVANQPAAAAAAASPATRKRMVEFIPPASKHVVPSEDSTPLYDE